MLRSLHLKDFVIVEKLTLDFSSGFSALTGETGAGKSILLDALALVTGGRADSAAVREGATKADLSAEFDHGSESYLLQWLAERELSGDETSLHLRRVIDADGRSKAFINGHPSTAALLKEVGEHLIDIHGQHASQSLMRTDGQRELLDSFAHLQMDVKALAQHFRDWQDTVKAIRLAEEQRETFEQQRERLQWRMDELNSLKLEPNEWQELSVEQKRLSNAAQLIETAQQAAAALSDDDAAMVNQLQSLLSKVKPLVTIDARLKPAFELLEAACISLDEASSDFSSYANKIDLDPARLATVDERIGLLFSTARKLKLVPDQLYDELTTTQAALASLASHQNIEALQRLADEALGRYQAKADSISAARKKAAAKLAKGVTVHLQALGMKGAKLEVSITATPPAMHGCDAIEFQVAGHEGVAARAISKVASGGELSRIGLAIAVLAAQNNPVPTLIFDEADAGIGGSVAEVVGKLMRSLGEARQVFCVTHLPQVAARAHHQYRVVKQTAKGKTISSVSVLTNEERVDEVARMLGGIDITDTTRKHASEMLKV